MSRLRRKASGERIEQDQRPYDESWKGILFDNKYYCRNCSHVVNKLEYQEDRRYRYYPSEVCPYCGMEELRHIGSHYKITGYLDKRLGRL